MNIKKIEKQLKKINQLFDTIKEDETMSAIERDLMLSYIRGLYEKIISPQNHASDDNTKPSKASKEEKSTQVVKGSETTKKVNNLADVVFNEVVEADAYPSQEHAFSPVKHQVSADNQKETAPVLEVFEETKPVVPQDILDLFEFQAISELSDKLSRAPVSDLTKCMGINEKIFTVQELFGGNSTLFNSAMETLDKFSSLEQARDYLVEHVAVEQKWSEKGKVKKAINFIKLISRRY